MAAEAGFEGIELVMGAEPWLRGARAIERDAAAHGLSIFSVHQALLRCTPLGCGPSRMLDAVRMALSLGCPLVVIHGPWTDRWDAPEAQRWLEALKVCQSELAGSATRLGLENPGIYSDGDGHNVLASFQTLASFARGHDLNLTFDTCHVGRPDLSLIEAYDTLRDRVTNIHLSDLSQGPFENHRLLRSVYVHHQLPGEGHLPLAEFLTHVAADGYCGLVTMEASPFALRSWSVDCARARLTHAAAYMADHLGRGIASRHADQAPSR